MLWQYRMFGNFVSGCRFKCKRLDFLIRLYIDNQYQMKDFMHALGKFTRRMRVGYTCNRCEMDTMDLLSEVCVRYGYDRENNTD